MEINNGFKILVSTDNHLGYKNDDPIRGNDSYNTFDELLHMAKINKVDFVILGGDLFHEKNPSHVVIDKAMDIMKKYVFGSKLINFHFAGNFNPNFIQEDINIELPIFLIHGNHDCPITDFGRFSCIQTLHTSNFLNYFGKQKDLNRLEVHPLLFAKNNSFIALYGIGYIQDIRLKSLFTEGLVEFKFPTEFSVDENKYFKILVLHQNRPQKDKAKNNIDIKLIPDIFDLIIWGHEHESIPNLIPSQRGFVYQPGSTIATSLIDAESKDKHVGLLRIKEKELTLEPLFLKTTRLIFCDRILLQTLINAEISKEDLIIEYIKEISKSLDQRYLDENKIYDQGLAKPRHMIRLKIEYFKSDNFRAKRIEEKLKGIVANENDIILPCKKSKEFNPQNQEIDISQHNLNEDEIFNNYDQKNLLINLLKNEEKEIESQLINPNEFLDWFSSNSKLDELLSIISTKSAKALAENNILKEKTEKLIMYKSESFKNEVKQKSEKSFESKLEDPQYLKDLPLIQECYYKEFQNLIKSCNISKMKNQKAEENNELINEKFKKRIALF